MQSLNATPGANYFGMNSLSAIDASQIRYVADARSTYRETEAQASLHQELVDLPAGPVAATVGGEFHREYGSTMPDRVTLAGDQAGPDQATTAGGYASREAFLDLRIPVISNVSTARELVLEGAARYANTSLFGDFPVWKSALSWAFSDDVRFRATFGAGHRVPAISEAFGGSTASFLSVQDPCDSANGSLSNRVVAANCRRLGLTSQFTQVSPLIEVTNGGNPHLHPEQSENHTLGIVVTPSWVKNLSLSTDYYAIRLKNAINSVSDTNPNFIPDQCFGSVNLTSPLCALITRIPSGPLAGQINRIAAPDENIGAIHTDGIDFALSYQADFSSLGHLSWDWQNSFLIDYRVQEEPGGPMIQYAGSFPSLTGGGSYSRYKSNLTTEFERGSVRAGWTVRYIDGAKVQGQTVALYDKTPGIFYHDVQIGWQQGSWRWTVGVDNLFDQKPPTLIDGETNTNSSTYDVIGRFFYLKASLQFP
jgi:outer membrane receptor protein involved in Fe transport